MFDVLEAAQIDFGEQCRHLFPVSDEGSQQIIPFLGAGVSISGRPPAHSAPPEEPPAGPAPPEEPPAGPAVDPMVVAKLAADLELTPLGRTLIEAARSLALLLKDSPPSNDRLIDRLAKDPYPPSARELARMLSELATYSMFQGLGEDLRRALPPSVPGPVETLSAMLNGLSAATGIAHPPDPLTAIAAYYENKNGREALWDKLSRVIARKTTTSPIHELIATAAGAQVGAEEGRDYLIITTNYDCLMEEALDRQRIPYVVLHTRKRDQQVVVRFSETCATKTGDERRTELERLHRMNRERYAHEFTLERPQRRIVVVHKLHGCLSPALTPRTDDGVVISDNDYVEFLAQMNTSRGVIPVAVSNMMRDKPFLFLGYSLSDWNVRGIFSSLRRKRQSEDEIRDFAVTNWIGEYERGFFSKNKIQVLKTDLNAYAAAVTQERARARPV